MKIKQLTSKRYTYKDKIYQVAMRGKMKIGEVWLHCIIYKSYDDGKVYVREQGDFFDKFKPIQ